MLRELLPRTDAGVAAQAVVVMDVLTLRSRLARDDRDLRRHAFATGVSTLGSFGRRTVR